MSGFIQHGAQEIDEAGNSAVNTNRFISPNSKETLQVVPLVDMEQTIPGQPVVIGYHSWKIWWDAQSAEKRRTELEAQNNEMAGKLFQVTEFPRLCADPDVDPGSWLQKNEAVIETAKVDVSTKYRKDGDPLISLSQIYLIPVLWINDPALNGPEGPLDPFEVKILKITQKSVYEGLKAFFKDSGGRFRNHLFSIRKDEKRPTYIVVGIEPWTKFTPELDVKPEEFIGMTTRKEIEERLELYGISIPPVPDNKKHILEMIEGTPDEDEPEVEEDDEWEDE